jgi:DNA (cytosine-5)-methyltransferase 1
MKYVVENPEPFIVQVNHAGEHFRGQSMDEPMPTITSKHGFGIVTPTIVKFQQNSIGQSAEEPLDTVMAGATRFGVVAPILEKYHGQKRAGETRARRPDEPILTLDTSNRFALVTAFISKYFGDGTTNNGSRAEEPLGTVTARDHNSLVAAHLVKLRGEEYGQDLNRPMPTVTAGGTHYGEVRAFLIKYYGQGTGQEMGAPLDTVTANDRFALVTIHGQQYAIVDIGLRMLEPRELFRAQGFTEEYIIAVDANGRPYPKKAQVARVGNSVCPPVAAALVRANLPECIEKAA